MNEEHEVLTIGWIDNKAVHFISTAYTTEIVTVNRRSGGNKMEVTAPMGRSQLLWL